MLFMITRTWEPNQAPAVAEKRATMEESGPPKDMNIIGEWVYLGGRKVFTLCDVKDSTPLIEIGMTWGNLMTVDIVPVTDGRLF
jgi:hypothetical protein